MARSDRVARRVRRLVRRHGITLAAVGVVAVGLWLFVRGGEASIRADAVTVDYAPLADNAGFGTGSYGPVQVAVTEVVVERLLSITVTLTNEDPNDAVTLPNSDLLLSVDGGRLLPAVVTSGSRRSEIQPGATETRTLGFEAPAGVAHDGLTLQVGSETVPTLVPLMAAPRPADGELRGPILLTTQSIGCGVDDTEREVAVDANLPLLVDLPPEATGRAPAGHRWVTVALEAGCDTARITPAPAVVAEEPGSGGTGTLLAAWAVADDAESLTLAGQ